MTIIIVGFARPWHMLQVTERGIDGGTGGEDNSGGGRGGAMQAVHTTSTCCSDGEGPSNSVSAKGNTSPICRLQAKDKGQRPAMLMAQVGSP